MSVMETKWKGSKARNIGGGFKLFYHGVDGKRNGVGVILMEKYSKSVVEVKRVSDRVMNVKLEFDWVMINVISINALQVGCEFEEKEKFWSELEEVVEVVMDRLTDEVRQESPWTMMFADDFVICGESREQVEKSLERWRYRLEKSGMKVSRSKTDYVCVNEREGSGVLRLQGEEVEKVDDFRYLGSTVQSNGECVREVKKRVQAGNWVKQQFNIRQKTQCQDDNCLAEEAEGAGVARICNLYGILYWKVEKRITSSSSVLQNLEEWKSIPATTCAALVNSMPRRIKAVLDNNAVHTKY
ncbi:hypothetical protein C0J45_4123 [Silurus meridionalis]|nr:hypothetical protein C0J45_4123 [Silurus meridionalis]